MVVKIWFQQCGFGSFYYTTYGAAGFLPLFLWRSVGETLKRENEELRKRLEQLEQN